MNCKEFGNETRSMIQFTTPIFLLAVEGTRVYRKIDYLVLSVVDLSRYITLLQPPSPSVSRKLSFTLSGVKNMFHYGNDL